MYPLASEEHYRDGETIFREDDPVDRVYVIKSGAVEISKTIRGKHLVLDTLERAEVLGEPGFLGCRKGMVDARAVGETTLASVDCGVWAKEFNRLSQGLKDFVVLRSKRFSRLLETACESSSRSAPRIPKTLAVSYEIDRSVVRAYAMDISAGGLFVKTGVPLMEGQEFLLQLQLPGMEEAMEIRCRVAWAKTEKRDAEDRPLGMGVKFLDISKADRDILRPYIKAIEKIGVPVAGMKEKDNVILKQYLDTIQKERPSES